MSAGGPGTTTHTFTGLTGHTHTLSVRAVNGIGTGPASSKDSSYYLAPSAVQGLAADVRAGAGAADVTWDPPLDDGGQAVEEYWVLVDGSFLGSVDAADPRDIEITGLERGNTYSIGVRAVNSVGAGPLTSVNAEVPAGKPGAPRIKNAKAGWPGGTSTAKAKWAPPTSDGGSAITGYKVFAYKLNWKGKVVKVFKTSKLPASKRAQKMHLPRGRYQFKVRAQNSEGWGKKSAKSNIVRAR